MPKTRKRVSVLADRIAAGKADPISAEERAIVAGLQAGFKEKYGHSPTARPEVRRRAVKSA